MLNEYETSIKGLCKYANVYLFATENPTPKEKKLEQRCTKIIDSFYNYTNYSVLKEALRNVETDHLLGRNEVIVNEMITDYATLQATYDAHVYDLRGKVKQEPILSAWYGEHIIPTKDTFKSVYEYLESLADEREFNRPDIKTLAGLYKSVYDTRIEELKLIWK